MSDLVKDCTAAMRACEDAAQNAEAELNGARIDEAGRTAKLEMARSSKRDAANQIALDREGQDDEALIAAVAAAQEKEARDRKSMDEAKVQLSDADPDSAGALLDNARQATKRVEE